jgi:hypothetical protein
MKSPSQGMVEPYQLDAGLHLFTDWRYVRPGMMRWDIANGQPSPLFAINGDPGPVHPHLLDAPQHLQIIAIPAQKIGPYLGPNEPWEKVVFWSTLIYDGGKYRLWYEAVPGWLWRDKSHANGIINDPGWCDLLCYAESDDLITWKRPYTGIANDPNQPPNIVYGGRLSPDSGYHGGTVFIDPSAPSNERYKIFYMGRIGVNQLRETEKRLGLQADTMAIHYGSAMFGAVSPDGFHWTPLPDPVMLANSDTANRVYFDPILNKYVAYMRMWLYGRRAVGRAETDDFTRWPLPEPVLWITPGNSPEVDIYTNARTSYPNSSRQHLMFPAFYHRVTDSTQIYMATSQEGRIWSFIPGGPVLSTGVAGEWDGGCIFAAGDLIEPGNGLAMLPFVGYRVPHKYPRYQPLGELGFATWQAGRLSALKATGAASFTTPQFIFEGSRLRLNLQTMHSGEVRVEIAQAEGSPRPVPQAEGPAFPGYSFAECDLMRGDLPMHTVTWRGVSDISGLSGKPISLRVQMRAASLFAFQID